MVLQSARRAGGAPRLRGLVTPVPVGEVERWDAMAPGSAPKRDHGIEEHEPRDALAPRVAGMGSEGVENEHLRVVAGFGIHDRKPPLSSGFFDPPPIGSTAEPERWVVDL